MSENFICPPRVPLWQFRREIDAILNCHLVLGNRPAPSQWRENRFLQNTVWAESFFQFAKPFRLERGGFRIPSLNRYFSYLYLCSQKPWLLTMARDRSSGH